MSSNAAFWLASEYAKCDDAVAYLRLRYVKSGWADITEIMVDSRGVWHSNKFTHKLCTIVEIDPSYQIVKDDNGKYQIEKYNKTLTLKEEEIPLFILLLSNFYDNILKVK